MSKICVTGSLNMDLVINTPVMPEMGETIRGYGFMTAPGGKGANQAVAAARLGAEVTMIGHVGDDMFGAELITNLSQNGVNTAYTKKTPGTATGIAVIVLKDGDNTIITDYGANGTITPAEIEEYEDTIKSSEILILQLEIPQDAVEKAAEIARRNGVKVLLNPAPARELSDDFLPQIDILTPNKNECEYITGLHVETVEDAKKAAKYLMDKGVKQVIITLGSNGSVYNDGSEIVHKTASRVKAVDTTAAGDSFTAGLAIAITKGKSISEAIDFANSVGAITVTRKGAQPSLPTIEEVEQYIATGVIPEKK